ncbi:MAG TPA: DUF6232 family protein [Micromonosporaceae bacterium]|nr:DUF6232 family protein [Micromonosporaceae bacterium]
MGVLTYYADDRVQVTSLAIAVDGHSYALGELATVWHRRSGRDRRGTTRRVALMAAPLAPVCAAIGVTALGLRHADSPVVRVALLVIAGLLLLGTVPLLDLTLGQVERGYDRGSRVHEIWARWRGSEVLLVRTDDRTRFGRIYRALQRALEAPTR